MPYREFLLGSDQYFHLYNRGNNHEKIIFERENYAYFLRLIRDHLPDDKNAITSTGLHKSGQCSIQAIWSIISGTFQGENGNQ